MEDHWKAERNAPILLRLAMNVEHDYTNQTKEQPKAINKLYF